MITIDRLNHASSGPSVKPVAMSNKRRYQADYDERACDDGGQRRRNSCKASGKQVAGTPTLAKKVKGTGTIVDQLNSTRRGIQKKEGME